jgi:hypothetical protein
MGEFRKELGAMGLGGKGIEGSRCEAMIRVASIEEAKNNMMYSEGTASHLLKYAGKRALAARLVRKRGPMVGKVRVHAVVYVPASASGAVRSAFIEEIGKAAERFNDEGLTWTIAGDWQAVPFPSWRANGRNNLEHDNAIRDWFWGAADEGDGAFMQRPGVGRVVPLHLQHDRMEFTFHSPRGDHASIDHVFSDHASAAYTSGTPRTPIFLGSRTDGHDEFACLDHRAILVNIREGEMESLGRQRPQAQRLRGSPRELKAFLEALPVEVGLEEDDDVALASLETGIAEAAAQTKRKFSARADVGRSKAPDAEATQLKYYEGLYKLVLQAYEEECCGVWAQGLFGSADNHHLYRDGMLRKARDKQLKRAARRPGGVVEWRGLRDACEHVIRNAITRLVPVVKAKAKEVAKATDMGLAGAMSAEEFARKLIGKQKAIKAAAREGGFSLAALKREDGEVVTSASEVHALAHAFGVKQNRASSCDEGLMGAWLQAFVPKAETLALPNGERWTLRKAIPYPVFCRETRKAKSGKAAALHPLLVDHLQAIPDEHPTKKLYYELLMRCMEAGRYPAHYRELVAVFIPKTYGNLLDLEALRDIWLINHGAKLTERLLLHTAIAPMTANVLLCHAGGCKGRGCVDQAVALHATIADAIATRKNLFVMYVDLIKCFMSFSRIAGRRAAKHGGLPDQVIQAMRGLVDCAVHGKATGRYTTAFGTTDPFVILRGFLQGALASPEMCKLMMNTLAEALQLKVVGYELYAPDGNGEWMTQLVFVDDAANITGSAGMMRRVALFWSIWLVIGDTKANIAKFKKTVVSGLVWKTKKDGTKVAISSDAMVYIGGLEKGDAPRKVPNMQVDKSYAYVGFGTRLDGKHAAQGLKLIKSKITNGALQATSRPTSRCLSIATGNAYTMGSCFFYGSVFGGSLQQVEDVLGPASRKGCRGGAVRNRSRSASAPAVQLHAPAKALEERKNDPMSVEPAARGRGMAGFGVAHPYPCLSAAAAMAFMNGLAAPLPTPANVGVSSGTARILHEFGCRATPSHFRFDELMDALDQSDFLERAIWLIAKLNDGVFRVEQNFRVDSPMHEDRWPGYPDG